MTFLINFRKDIHINRTRNDDVLTICVYKVKYAFDCT